MAGERMTFQWDDPFLLDQQLTEEERLVRNTARTYAQEKLAPRVQWEHSYVTENKTFCIYLADSVEAVREHARLSGFPANIVTLVNTLIDPTTER